MHRHRDASDDRDAAATAATRWRGEDRGDTASPAVEYIAKRATREAAEEQRYRAVCGAPHTRCFEDRIG